MARQSPEALVRSEQLYVQSVFMVSKQSNPRLRSAIERYDIDSIFSSMTRSPGEISQPVSTMPIDPAQSRLTKEEQ